MGIAKVTRNYQITIPKDIRSIQDIHIGDTVLFAIEGTKVDFLKMNRDKIIDSVSGSWQVKESSVDYVKNLRKGWKKRRMRLGL